LKWPPRNGGGGDQQDFKSTNSAYIELQFYEKPES